MRNAVSGPWRMNIKQRAGKYNTGYDRYQPGHKNMPHLHNAQRHHPPHIPQPYDRNRRPDIIDIMILVEMRRYKTCRSQNRPQ
jgi:hypothetical protein